MKHNLSNISKDILELILNYNYQYYSHKDLLKVCLVCKNINIKLLKRLYLKYVKFDNINFLQNCDKIIELNLLNTNIIDISPIQQCINILPRLCHIHILQLAQKQSILTISVVTGCQQRHLQASLSV